MADMNQRMPRDARDYKLDLATHSASPATAAAAGGSRPFLSIHFACCNVYLRLYRAAGAAEYTGRCPRCGKSVKFPVGQGGTHARAFRVE